MDKFFITATGTEIGKTLITTTICYQFKMAGKKVSAFKPIISGYDSADMKSDTALILQSLDLSVTPENIEAISPWRFKAPLAPNMAAEREGKDISLDEVVSFCKEKEKNDDDILLVEGVGGVCTPISYKDTVLDWVARLDGWKVILVVGSYLGAISHILTAIKALEVCGIKVHSLIVSESENSTVTIEETIETLVRFLSKEIVIISVPRQKECDSNYRILWEKMPRFNRVYQ